ncbi:hypothetical protein CNMCM6936_002624 [Aspergillus lentulus]|nr:hypothetical protein CNMCM6936_002624 [Aspergillus lentulus]
MNMAILPPEILHDILGRTTPSWRWGWRWKKWRKTMLARADLLWFLNLRVVNKQFDDIVIDHFHTAIKAGFIDRKLPICDGAPNPSTMAMARRLLCSLVESSRRQGGATRSVYPLVDTINAGVDGVVEFFSHRSDVDIEELRSRYLSGMIAMFVGLAGTNFIDRLLAPAGAGGETMVDGLDYESEGWSGTASLAAAYLGRTDDMEDLLAWRIKNTADPDRSLHLPLMAAAFGGQWDSVRFLIDRGVDINTRTVENGDTAVHFAALGGHASLVNYLLEAGADADVVNNAGDTPLLLAARGGHADVVRELLKTGEVDVNFRDRLRRAPLIWAAARGFDNVVKELLLREEIDVNIMDGVVNLLAGPIYHAGSAGVPGGSPLEVAAMIGREDVFQRLYRHPQAYRELSTVFPRALTGGKASIVRTIIQAFPNTLEDYESSYEETAFLRAAEDSSEEVVRYLLSLNKTPINYQDRDGKTALYFAVKSGDLGKVTALLEHPDVNVNLRTDELSGCQSLLHCAVNQRCVDPKIMKALLARPDVNVNARDYGGRTPIAYAAFNGQAELVKLLLQRQDVDLFPLDRFGDTPLLLAAKEGESHIMNILLEVPGTDIWHRNNWDKTALGLAGESGHAEVVRRLLDPGFKVTREIICDAIENTKEALDAIRRTATSFLGSENERLAQERRIEEAYKGLGAVICQKFAAEGCNVAINYHSSHEVAEDLASRLAKEYSIKSIVLQGDSELPEDNQRIVQEANEQLSGLDIVIANAGWTRFADRRDIYDLSFEEWDKARLNVMSHVQLMQAAKPIFDKNPDGGVYIMTSSIAGITPDGSSMGYSVTKAAALHLMKHLALSVGPKIRVNAVLPGLLLTDWGKKYGETAIEWINQKAILKHEVMLLSAVSSSVC